MSPLHPGIAGINLVVVCPTFLGCTADIIPHGGAIRGSIASTEQPLSVENSVDIKRSL